jgi:hypothetical protein
MADPHPTPENFTSCSRTECGGLPAVQPAILVYAPAEKGGGPVETVFAMALCRACQRTATLEDFDSEDFRKTVLNVLRSFGLADPDWTRNRLIWKAVK